MGEVSFNQSNHRICFINLVRVIQIIIIIIIIIIIVFNKSWQAQPVQNIDSELYNRLNDSLQAEPVYKWKWFTL